MKKVIALSVIMLLTACVTINVYFPEAEAKEAASESVERIMGIKKDINGSQSSLEISRTVYLASQAVINFIVPPAHAAESPAVKKIEGKLKARFSKMAPFFDAGIIGLTNDGMVAVKNLKAASPKDRGKVKKLVSNENKDRKALYSELARADGNPQWAKKHQSIYAKTWIEKAQAGWWYQNDKGDWVKK